MTRKLLKSQMHLAIKFENALVSSLSNYREKV